MAPIITATPEEPIASMAAPHVSFDASTAGTQAPATMLEWATSTVRSGITTITQHPAFLRQLSLTLAILSSFLLAYYFSRLQVRWNTMIHKYGDQLVDSALFGQVPPSINHAYASLLHRGESKHMHRMNLLLREMSLDSEQYAEEIFALRYYWSQFLEDTTAVEKEK